MTAFTLCAAVAAKRSGETSRGFESCTAVELSLQTWLTNQVIVQLNSFLQWPISSLQLPKTSTHLHSHLLVLIASHRIQKRSPLTKFHGRPTCKPLEGGLIGSHDAQEHTQSVRAGNAAAMRFLACQTDEGEEHRGQQRRVLCQKEPLQGCVHSAGQKSPQAGLVARQPLDLSIEQRRKSGGVRTKVFCARDSNRIRFLRFKLVVPVWVLKSLLAK